MYQGFADRKARRIEKLGPMEAEELVAFVGDAPLSPFGWTWEQHGLKTLPARLY
jgi:hypothetical protein